MNGNEASVSPSTDNVAAPAMRACCEGVGHVARFNWPLYAVGFAAASVAIAAALLIRQPHWLIVLLYAGAAAAAYLLIASLLVSLWVYDLSALHRFQWARDAVDSQPGRILNLHSGFDESSAGLLRAFPGAQLEVMDFYDPTTMTEPSIARARRYQQSRRPADITAITRSVPPAALPVDDACIDAAFAVLAAHEVRRPDERLRLFVEIARALRPGGRLIVVEHLRNAPNFLAFGPQFMHFYSRATWLGVARAAGFAIVRESRITPFLGLFVFEKKLPSS